MIEAGGRDFDDMLLHCQLSIKDVCVSVYVGVNSFLVSLSTSDDDSDRCLYEILKHCGQLGVLAVINADTQPSFTSLVSHITLIITSISSYYDPLRSLVR